MGWGGEGGVGWGRWGGESRYVRVWDMELGDILWHAY